MQKDGGSSRLNGRTCLSPSDVFLPPPPNERGAHEKPEEKRRREDRVIRGSYGENTTRRRVLSEERDAFGIRQTILVNSGEERSSSLAGPDVYVGRV